MAETLTLYTNPMSRGQIARWMIHEVRLPYETEIISYGEQMGSAAYRAVNPMAKVPAIRHGDRVVTEAAAICAYLADAVPEAGLAPPTIDRADYYRWLFFAAGPVETAVTTNALGFTPSQEQEAMVGFGSYGRAIDTLEGWLEGREYVAGDRFTAADVYVGAQVIWGVAFGTLPKRPAFEAYAGRLTQREAYQSAKAIDDELIAAMKAAAE